MAKQDTKEQNYIYIQLKDKNSSWQYKKGVYLRGDRVAKTDGDNDKVKQAIKMGVIIKVDAPKVKEEKD